MYASRTWAFFDTVDEPRPALARRFALFVGGGRTTLLLVHKDTGQIAGLDLYYFNDVDFEDRTIHEGFVGIHPDFRGQGLATELRSRAIAHFRTTGLRGISTRISVANRGSMKSAEGLGFKARNRYFDETRGEDRLYLVLTW